MSVNKNLCGLSWRRVAAVGVLLLNGIGTGTYFFIHYQPYRIMALAAVALFVFCACIFIGLLSFVKRPIRKLIEGTRAISQGDYYRKVDVGRGVSWASWPMPSTTCASSAAKVISN